MRIVLDTNVLVRAHGRSSARARDVLTELLKRGHQLVLSNQILAEMTRVLRYPRLQALFGLSEKDLLDYAQFLQSVSHLVILDAQYRAPVRDPNDLVVLQTAELGEADILCTRDSDFYDPVVLSYCMARGIEVCDEAALIERLALD